MKYSREMASDLEPVAVTPQKHDPAWKHCQMYKIGDKVQLKCLYCEKIFKGGGIHRIKEHLACQKGNAATCLRVLPDVRLQMLESLNGVAAKKRKKHKLTEETSSYDNTGTIVVHPLSNDCGLKTDIDLLPVPELLEHNVDVYSNREDIVSGNIGGRKKKGRIRKAPDVANANANAIAFDSFQVMKTEKISDPVYMAVGRFFFDVGLPSEAVNSAYFKPMVNAIASQGVEAIGPSFHDLRSWILKNAVHESRGDVDTCRRDWEKNGCTILVDERNLKKGKTFVNFFVYCPVGTVFLRSADVSDAGGSADALYDLLKQTVEEVGMKNVLQVVTSSEDRYIIAGRRLSDSCPTVFWSPCTRNCIDLMLKDIGELPRVKIILDQAKSISRFVYSNHVVLNMMRRFTFGIDLVDLGITRYSTDFATLKRMLNVRHYLQSMIASEEWMESPYSKKPLAFSIQNYVNNESFWSTCASIIRLTDPLLRLQRIVCSEKRPAMGYVCAGIYRAKETIKKELADTEDYLLYWNIIDRRWEQVQHHPLHAAGFYFNPRFFYNLEGDVHHHIRSLVYDCIEKLVSDPKIQDKIMKETASFQGAVGDFGRKMAVRARDTLIPTEWWSAYGGGCPNLAHLAIRILSQTCSLIPHKLNHIPLEQMHERKNCLEHQRLSDLVFVQYNMSLKNVIQSSKEQGYMDPISYEKFEIMEDWIMEKEIGSESSETADWMAVDPALGNTTLLGSPIDDFEALGSGFEDFEIFDWVKESEENGNENMASM